MDTEGFTLSFDPISDDTVSQTRDVGPVGGYVASVDKQSVLMPWLAVIGLVGCIGTLDMVARKRHQ
jgi:hypothetical protein